MLKLELKDVVKLLLPPELTLPVTTLKAELLLFDVSFVHPVGAELCWKNILVPEGKELTDGTFVRLL